MASLFFVRSRHAECHESANLLRRQPRAAKRTRMVPAAQTGPDLAVCFAARKRVARIPRVNAPPTTFRSASLRQLQNLANRWSQITPPQSLGLTITMLRIDVYPQRDERRDKCHRRSFLEPTALHLTTSSRTRSPGHRRNSRERTSTLFSSRTKSAGCSLSLRDRPFRSFFLGGGPGGETSRRRKRAHSMRISLFMPALSAASVPSCEAARPSIAEHAAALESGWQGKTRAEWYSRPI